MNNPPNDPARFVTCRCQHCNGNIEFDASGFQPGQTRSAECPHCHLETLLFIHDIPNQKRVDTGKSKPANKSLSTAGPNRNWIQTFLTSQLERTIFTVIRVFSLFWAMLMLFGLTLLTLAYLSTFLPGKAVRDEPQSNFFAKLIESETWQNFATYFAGVSFILTMLTLISIVLVLLAIERNTRPKE